MNRHRSTVIALTLAAALFLAACAQPPSGSVGAESGGDGLTEEERQARDAVTPEEEARVDASNDDAREPPPEQEDVNTETDTDWTWTWTVDYSLETFESATQLSQSLVRGTVIAVGPTRWNTESGEQGLRSAWNESSVDPLQWQILTIDISETLATGVDDYGDRPSAPDEGPISVAYLVHVPGYVEVPAGMVGAEVLVGVTSSPIEYLDGPTTSSFILDPQASYIAPVAGGAAYRFYSAATGSDYKTAMESSVTPDGRTADVVSDIDSLMNRARDPSSSIEDHLGYSDLPG